MDLENNLGHEKREYLFPVKERDWLSCTNLKCREVTSNLDEVELLTRKVLVETK